MGLFFIISSVGVVCCWSPADKRVAAVKVEQRCEGGAAVVELKNFETLHLRELGRPS